MGLVDFFIKFGTKKIDSRNIIRNALVGWAMEDNPQVVIAIIDMMVSEAIDAKEIIKQRITNQAKIGHIQREKAEKNPSG